MHPGSPAEAAGVKVGDVVVRFDGFRVHSFEELVAMVRQQQPGETITMQIERNGKKMNVEVTIDVRK